jgi:sigma-E factor negative regulatory protein RseB
MIGPGNMRIFIEMLYKMASVILTLFIFSASVNAGNLSEMLQRISRADQDHNYQGTFILRKSDELSSLRVTHGNDEKGVWETMEALNGEPRKVIRRNNQVVSIYPDRELVTVRQNSNSHSLHPQLPENLDQLDYFYDIQQLDDDRIANHQSLVIDLIPKDKLRYGYRYWVDKNTGMLLRCDLVDENGSVIEQMMFTSLTYLTDAPEPPVLASQFEQYRQKTLDNFSVKNDESAVALKDEGPKWTVNVLPKGFVLTQSNMRHSVPLTADAAAEAEARRPDLLHMVYSDGLASVSVFIGKKHGDENFLLGASKVGAMNAFGSSADDYFVTVVGEVPMKTVQSMAQSTARIK